MEGVVITSRILVGGVVVVLLSLLAKSLIERRARVGPPAGAALFRRLKAQLDEARAAFRADMEGAGAAREWQRYPGRIGVALSGGGARGAYEAGVLLAFQDAGLPTHIITATSVGSINAASYAAHSDSLVGNAEFLVESWMGLTPVAVGIEWTRYAWMLTGLVAATAGLGNLLRVTLPTGEISVHLHNPALTWATLMLAGGVALLLFDRLPYLGFAVRNALRGSPWKPDRGKAALSLLANVVVWGFLLVLLRSLHVHSPALEWAQQHPLAAAGSIGLLVLLLSTVSERGRARVGTLLHAVLRAPLRSGLFPNFERSRFLHERISGQRLRASPIRVLFACTDLRAAEARFFSNRSREDLAGDPDADSAFVRKEVTEAEDPIRAVVASSAMPIAYEPLRLGAQLYSDGGIVTNQPIRPAIRLGANVLFLVLVEPPQSQMGEVRTFLDVGLRALDILMMQNLLTDLKILENVNQACERAAAELGLRPEEVEIEFGTRCYRYVKAFRILPATPLEGMALDFTLEVIGPAIVQGYRDACPVLKEFLSYVCQGSFGKPRRVLRLSVARDPGFSAEAAPRG